MVLVGPSGCGKTTALRMVAGLEDITEGAVRIGDRTVNDLSPRARDIAMVFQSYALYPHLSVYDNLAFPLKIARASREEIRRRVGDVATMLDLEPYLKRKPRALSGGQRQRVAMGRAIIRQPQVFLMDEPLSNLDAKLRVQMRAGIKKLQSDLGITTIYVTHDQVEAMTMGDRVAVMRKGELQQVDDPEALYQRPRNVFVGGFIGSPAMNMLEATVERRNGTLDVVAGEVRIGLDEATLAMHPGLASYENHTIVVGIRPEAMEDAALVHGAPGPRLRGKADLREALGAEVLLHFSVAARQAVTEEVRELAEDIGDDRVLEQLSAGAPAAATLVGRFSPQTRIREGDLIEVAHRPARTALLRLADRPRDLRSAARHRGMTGRELEARPVADDDLAGRTALVTGGGSAIELASVRTLVGTGARVAALDRHEVPLDGDRLAAGRPHGRRGRPRRGHPHRRCDRWSRHRREQRRCWRLRHRGGQRRRGVARGARRRNDTLGPRGDDRSTRLAMSSRDEDRSRPRGVHVCALRPSRDCSRVRPRPAARRLPRLARKRAAPVVPLETPQPVQWALVADRS